MTASMSADEARFLSERRAAVSFGCAIAAIALLGVTISTPRPWRIAPLVLGLAAAGWGARNAQKGETPSELWAMHKAAEMVCIEAEHENALEEIQTQDDMERELGYRERVLQMEAEAMVRTLPARLEMQKIERMLNPMPIAYPAMLAGMQQQYQAPAGQPGLEQQLGQPPTDQPEPAIAYNGPTSAYFQWEDLKNIDKYPVVVVIGGMGAGKSKFVKWLSKHVLKAQIRAWDAYGRTSEWQGATLLCNAEQILDSMEQDLLDIEAEAEEFRGGRNEFPERVTIMEEAPDTLSELRSLNKKRIRESRGRVRDIVGPWMLKYSTFTRKIRRRLIGVSVSMAAAEFIPQEHRSKAVAIFPGTAIGEIMADTTFYRLGTRQNEQLRAELSALLSAVKNPALVYAKGRWYPASLPDLDLEGNPANYTPSTPSNPNPAPHNPTVNPTGSGSTPPSPPPADSGESPESNVQRLERLFRESEDLES
jgi:hypothetical protein